VGDPANQASRNRACGTCPWFAILKPVDPREVAAGIWVGSVAARKAGSRYDLIVDCLGAPNEPNDGCRVEVVTPNGRTGHTWEPGDLEAVVSVAAPVLGNGGRVLIHCRRGVSRSATAAAAVILHLGIAADVEDAVNMVRRQGSRPANSSVGSLSRWWSSRE
jgi:hypothetical protein